ncbi:radical SAM protein [Alphaproteobacteria bacterium]|nr:radical SAM protein [Alphaproteobacteria bacterium]
MDIVFITPNNASITYQSLSEKYSAIEPPTWALLLAESVRAKGFEPAIIDTLAEQISDNAVVERIVNLKPTLIAFVVYGQNVNAGTTNMSGAVRLATALKKAQITTPIGFIGSHVQALPQETMEKELSVDFVCLNEGIYSILEALETNATSVADLLHVSGLAVRVDNKILFTGPGRVVPKDRMDLDMPGYAWDLLPFDHEPLDLYRAPYWHAEYRDEFRTPYAALQTSIGCQFKCSFCMINLINKNDESPVSIASDYNGMRHWSAEFVKRELKKLVVMGVKTIRITDEMFLLNRKYYMPILEILADLNKNDDLRLWAYSRIDTVPNPQILALVRKAGIRWLCLGIESGDKGVRLEVAKGKFEEVDVEKVVQQVEEAGINVMANYIFGLPGDNEETIQKTYDLSVKLNTLGWNTYAAMALPGSPLYTLARSAGTKLPEAYEEFSFHSYETLPLPTATLSAARILQLRDQKFTEYFGRPEFLKKIERQFGQNAVNNIVLMNQKKLKRKIIEVDPNLNEQVER